MSDQEVLLKRVKYYRQKLQEKIKERQMEMQQDKNTHYMIYNALGFTDEEGYEIDYQQNVGRFLYKYAGTMVEDLVLQCIKDAGYVPVRIMLFDPERSQAMKIQKKLKELYKEVDGEYYSGEAAWEYLKKITGTDLKKFFENLKE